ncbi:MAG: DUF4123 domain-containing protein [Acidobacteria bacterium]|nr:DUF4123 domain-containing protein [Acidobacteriota bacterium]
MPIYLEVINGKYAAGTVSLEDGDVARVGRGARADMCLPDDFGLAETHFLLAFDGYTGRLIDSGSSSGTFVGGKRILAAEIETNCRISAGESEFAVLFEQDFGVTKPETPIKRLVEFLRSRDGDLFCLLDAARDEKILSLLRKSNSKHMSLYQGESQRQMAHVAPYLVEFDKSDVFLERLWRHGWGKRWCTFFSSRAGFGHLRKHFRRFLFVKDERGASVYFRFYDPSIMRTFLPACTDDELKDFFGYVDHFYTEDEMPSRVKCFGRDDALPFSETTFVFDLIK